MGLHNVTTIQKLDFRLKLQTVQEKTSIGMYLSTNSKLKDWQSQQYEVAGQLPRHSRLGRSSVQLLMPVWVHRKAFEYSGS